MGKSNSLQHFLSTLSHLQSHFPNPEQLDIFLNLSLPHPHPPSRPPEASSFAESCFLLPWGVFLEFTAIHCDINSFLTILKDICRVIHSKTVGCRLLNRNWHPRNPHIVMASTVSLRTAAVTDSLSSQRRWGWKSWKQLLGGHSQKPWKLYRSCALLSLLLEWLSNYFWPWVPACVVLGRRENPHRKMPSLKYTR